ncbi:hypothetical protein M5D96_010745, partial [Drosophila gunungcola]
MWFGYGHLSLGDHVSRRPIYAAETSGGRARTTRTPRTTNNKR